MMIFNIVMIVLFSVFMFISGYRVLTNHMDKNIEIFVFIISFTCLVSNVVDLVGIIG